MKFGIIHLPYNIENLKPILQQASQLPYDFYFFDKKKIENITADDRSENVHYIDADPFDSEMIEKFVKSHKINHVISFAELGLLTAAKTRENLLLRGHFVANEMLSVNKYHMRIRLAESNLTKIKFCKVLIKNLKSELVNFGFPAIVKPVNLVGSIGVQLIEKEEQIDRYIERLRQNFYSKDQVEVLLEEYINGPEFSAEGLILDGNVYLYGVTEKRTSEKPYFVEEGHSFFSDHTLRPLLERELPKIFSSLEMFLCPFHVEFKYKENYIEVIEAHTRFAGGFITDLIQESMGSLVFRDYFNYLANAAKPVLKIKNNPIVSVQFLLLPKCVMKNFFQDVSLANQNILYIKSHFKAGDQIEPATGYYERVARVCFKAEDVNMNNQLINRIKHLFLKLKKKAYMSEVV